jgi:hypothetical protein
MIEYPLTRANRIRLGRAFRNVPRVDLSIPCLLEDQIGRVYVDDPDHPSAFVLRNGVFNYYAGDPHGPGVEAVLAQLEPYTLIMPSAPGWLEAIQARYGEQVQPFERYSFSSEGLSQARLDHLWQISRHCEHIRPIDVDFVGRLWGQDYWLDLSEFESPQDFNERGFGFMIYRSGKLAGAAWSSLVCSQGIEVSVFVQDDYRRQGMALALCARLLSLCLELGLQAHWDAANLESCALATKLGYKFAESYTAYYRVDG